MILFNTTFCVDANIIHDFKIFLEAMYVPGALNCGMTNPLLGRPRFDAQPNAITGQMAYSYALQMIAPSQEILDRFRGEALPELYEMISQWGNSLTLFETELDIEPIG